MRRVSRGAVFWGSALVTAGLLILAIQQGLIDEALLLDIGQWWPLLLIGAGVAIVFAGALGVVAVALSGVLLGLLVGGLVSGATSLPVGCGNDDPEEVSVVEDGTFSGDAPTIHLELDCATLILGGGSGDDWSVEADEDTADEIQVESGDDQLTIRTDDDETFATGDRRHLEVTVPRDTGASLGVSVNAADTDLDLSDGAWSQVDFSGNAMATRIDLSGAEAEDVSVTLNAGSAKIQLGEGTTLNSPMRLGANAGSMEVCAPAGIGLEIAMGEDVTVGHNLDAEGLSEDNGVWRTDGFEDADTQIEIEFEGNAASFTLNPEGGCS
jgi:hypothetical protein